MKKYRRIPFGYSVSNGSYVINPEEAETVKRIFTQYTGGSSLKEIARMQKVPYYYGKTIWNKNMVKRVLENRKYLGENGFPQIIVQDEFYKAQQVKAERNKYKSRNNDVSAETVHTQYEVQYQQSVEVIRLTNKINQMLNMRDYDKETIAILILQCADEKYQCIKCVERGNENERIQ